MEENALLNINDEYVEQMFLGQIENPIAMSGLSLSQVEQLPEKIRR